MNLQYLAHAFFEELEKIAYGAKEHAALATKMINAAAGGKAGDSVRALARSGALEADQGIRHPWLPYTDPIHSFAGSQSRKMIGKNVADKQRAAIQDIAKSIGGGGLLSGTRASRGLKNLGEAHHQLIDISAHYDKPIELGVSTRARNVLPRTGYGGGVVGGVEHQRTGLYLTPDGDVSANLDKLRPKESASDRMAILRTPRFGNSTQRQVRTALVKKYGFTPEDAERAVSDFFTGRTPSASSQTLGSLSRDSRYLKGELRRPMDYLRGRFRND